MANHEMLDILEMVRDGVITAEEGQKLMEALQTNQAPQRTEVKAITKRRMVHISVDSCDGDRVRVNVPTSLIKAGVDLAGKMNIPQLKEQNIDLDMVVQAIQDDFEGELVNVESADGDIVKITID